MACVVAPNGTVPGTSGDDDEFGVEKLLSELAESIKLSLLVDHRPWRGNRRLQALPMLRSK
jgi:hypothetical protein